MKKLIVPLILILNLSCKSYQSAPVTSESTTHNVSGLEDMDRLEGFFNIYWDSQDGKVWMVIDKLDSEFLYVNSLVTGIGSNDIGLDRGQFGRNRVVKFLKAGPKILLIQPNYAYRANSDNPYEKKAVEDSFAESVLWGFMIEEKISEGFLVDATEFFLNDAHQVSLRLEDTRQGKYSIDPSRSSIDDRNLKNFPENTEVESILTFRGRPAGSFVQDVVPSPEAITVRQRHSLIKLPEPGYPMRTYDPRSGYFGISFYDYATPFTEPIEKKFIVRHRLIKKDPAEEIGEPVEPIVYYLDPGTPEPVRSALLEGASWWEEAFEAAGFINAFQVKLLPEGADPLDVRYNVIQWVHRATRGWSYGHSVIDPRTGEIIKGHVSLGSLRIRQDFLIAQGLLSPYTDGETDLIAASEMALARIRQLSAHEVGHTLGLAHNYAASVRDRASVMDYPHPLIELTDEGGIDLTNAYDTGIGEWDQQAIKYGYTEFPENEESGLQQIIHENIEEGLYFISDKDARPEGSAHPHAHLWDNNSNAANELNRINEIRRIALNNLGLNSIPDNYPVSDLEEVIVPVFLLHRYQLEAASKMVAGLYYSYAHKGDSQKITEIVPAESQRMALKAIMQTIHPEFLEIPERLLQLLPPEALGSRRMHENFEKKTGLTFDPMAAAESAAELSIRLMLHPERASRLVEYNSRNEKNPGLKEVLDLLIENTWQRPPLNPYHAEISRTVNLVAMNKIMELANSTSASGQVRALALASLYDLESWIQDKYKREKDFLWKAHYQYGLERIRQFKQTPENFLPEKSLPLPMGPPIGNGFLNCEF